MDEHTHKQPKQEQTEQAHGNQPAQMTKQEQTEQQHAHQPAQMFRAKSGAETITQKRSWKQKLKEYLIECKRVLKVTKKPNKQEFKTIVKISGLGIIFIGLLGFFIYFLKELFI